jgi:hypothetical protein
LEVFLNITSTAWILVSVLALAGCQQEEPKRKGTGTPGTGSGGQNSESIEVLDQKNTSEKTKQNGSNEADAAETANAADNAFADWCKNVRQASTATKLGKYLDQFCNGTTPTALLTTTLIAKAYTGSGDAGKTVVHIVAPRADSAKKTSIFHMGAAIKIPTTSKAHFEKVGPVQGDPEKAKDVGIYPEGSDVTLTILDSRTKSGKFHVRGWTTEAVTETTVIIKVIRTHTITLDDQFDFGTGKAYMFASVLKESKERIKDSVMLTASIETAKGSYLINQTYVEIENDGLHTFAVSQIENTAKQLVLNMYKAAK